MNFFDYNFCNGAGNSVCENSCNLNSNCGCGRSNCSRCNGCRSCGCSNQIRCACGCGRPCPTPQPVPPTPVRPVRPFLSSFVEGVGNSQSVAAGADVVFHDTEVVGTDISVSQDGKTFTIITPGLYHVEWSLNLASGLAVVGILENGEAASAFHHADAAGNLSSGSLINVTKVPFTISLRNFNGDITLENPVQYQNTAASIRIVRFADGAKVLG